MMNDATDLHDGMHVVTSDGEVLGKVKDVPADGRFFRVDCPHAPDLYVPAGYLQRVDGQQAILRASKRQVAYLGWELRPDTYGQEG